MQVHSVRTTPFDDQKPGTAGLRKKVRTVQQPHYLENFLQSVLDCSPELRQGTLVIGGDGRYHNRVAIQTAIRMAAAHGVRHVIVGKDGLLSTPAASHLIRLRKAQGGFVLTASHNPAGAEGDFGIKFNIAGGGQAPEALTDRIYAATRNIEQYRIAELPEIDLGSVVQHDFGDFLVEVVDSVSDYASLMQSLFDFDQMRHWLENGGRIRFDGMHAVTGPYAQRILVEQLGASADSILNGTPLEDFGGGHPDPNLIYARELVDQMMRSDAPDLAAASDGDGDRNMILGRGLFISPGDSLAMLASHLEGLPGYRRGLQGVARSMPTSRAIDVVAKARGWECHETPTGWKFFCNLLDAGRLTLCGEESFGTSSDHVREKDGLWAALAWMNVLANTGLGVREIAQQHWNTYGRHYYQRHDYEDLDAEVAEQIVAALGISLSALPGREFNGLVVSEAGSFSYTDPVDGSVARDQGLRVVFGDDARVVLRKSGTGTGGVTLRLYLERYSKEALDDASCLDTLADIAESLTQLRTRSGKASADVVT
jgi:phosphoglucomutase